MAQEEECISQVEEKIHIHFQNTRQLSNEVYRIKLSEQTCKDFGLELIRLKDVRIVDLEHPLEDYVFITPTDAQHNWFVSIRSTFLEQVN